MGFKTVETLDCDVVVALGRDKDAKGKVINSIEGYYLGARPAKTEYGDATIHVFKTPAGNQGTWGNKNMNDGLLSVVKGEMTRVTANGLAPKRPGKNPMKLYKVEHDPDNSIEVAAASANDGGYDAEADAGEYETGDDSGNEFDEDSEEPETFEPEFVAARTKSAAPTAQKVQDLLNKRSAIKK